jgi:hypothetical protein
VSSRPRAKPAPRPARLRQTGEYAIVGETWADGIHGDAPWGQCNREVANQRLHGHFPSTHGNPVKCGRAQQPRGCGCMIYPVSCCAVLPAQAVGPRIAHISARAPVGAAC